MKTVADNSLVLSDWDFEYYRLELQRSMAELRDIDNKNPVEENIGIETTSLFSNIREITLKLK